MLKNNQKPQEETQKANAKEAWKIIKWVFGLFLKILPKVTKTRIAISLALGFQGIVSSYILSKIMDALINSVKNPRAEVLDLLPYLALMFGFNLFTLLLNHIDFISSEEFYEKTDYLLEITLTNKLLDLGIGSLEQPDVNNKIFRAKNSVRSLARYVTQCVDILTYFGILLVSLALLLIYAPVVVPIVAICVIPEFLVDKKYQRKIWNFSLVNTEKTRMAWRNVDQLSSTTDLPEIYINNIYSYLLDKFKNYQDWFVQKRIEIFKSWENWGIPARIMQFISVYAGYLLIFRNLLKGLTSVGSIFFQIRLIQNVQDYLRYITSGFNNILEFTLRIKDFYDIFQMEGSIPNGTQNFPKLNKGPEIKIEDLSFYYPNSEKEVLKNINLTIKPGEKIAIVGENGAGKTTLVKLLCRMYLPTTGRILVDNKNLAHLKSNDWYENLGVLFQEYNTYPQLTLRENIMLGKIESLYKGETLNNDAVKAARDANLLATVGELPNGWDQILDEKYKGGVRLSTGQWQKVAIARMFYRNPPVVIFDEPTASIDAVSEYKIFNKIYEFFTQKTVIIISHRFSTVRNADRIVVLDKGKIAEEGTHDQLIKIEGGIYSKSFELQQRGYI